jgi:hypothetical protein
VVLSSCSPCSQRAFGRGQHGRATSWALAETVGVLPQRAQFVAAVIHGSVTMPQLTPSLAMSRRGRFAATLDGDDGGDGDARGAAQRGASRRPWWADGITSGGGALQNPVSTTVRPRVEQAVTAVWT